MSELTDAERASYFEKRCHEATAEANRYRTLLCEAHALIGRLTHQLSKRWDTAPITEFMKDLLK